MKPYESYLQACIRYIVKNGKSQATIDRLETMLPGAWSAELIADAIDQVDATIAKMREQIAANE